MNPAQVRGPVQFPASPESEQLREASERYLAEGKQVSIKITLDEGQPKYELIIKE
jgi:hypothetical protein